MENEEPNITLDNRTLRTKLVQMVLEEFVNLNMWEALETQRLEIELQSMFKNMLAFGVHVEVDHAPETVITSTFRGKMSFMDDHDEQQKIKIIDFEVLPTMIS